MMSERRRVPRTSVTLRRWRLAWRLDARERPADPESAGLPLRAVSIAERVVAQDHVIASFLRHIKPGLPNLISGPSRQIGCLTARDREDRMGAPSKNGPGWLDAGKLDELAAHAQRADTELTWPAAS